MESSRAQWTDARLDDLAGRIDRLESRMDAGFNSLDAKVDRLQQTLIVSMASVMLTFAGQIFFGG
ncbi:MAG: hypothetical protein M3Y75_00100 [Actinomycetota bacterium]|nr:hypothetical protein [Actinomycetota bacterium]